MKEAQRLDAHSEAPWLELTRQACAPGTAVRVRLPSKEAGQVPLHDPARRVSRQQQHFVEQVTELLHRPVRLEARRRVPYLVRGIGAHHGFDRAADLLLERVAEGEQRGGWAGAWERRS